MSRFEFVARIFVLFPIFSVQIVVVVVRGVALFTRLLCLMFSFAFSVELMPCFYVLLLLCPLAFIRLAFMTFSQPSLLFTVSDRRYSQPSVENNVEQSVV